MNLFVSSKLGSCELKNKIIRSATFEGMCDDQGLPSTEYKEMYKELAGGGVGGIITGFAFISPEGKAMQPGQAGMDSEYKIQYYFPITEEVHRYGSKIFMQLAHTGRQTRKKETKQEVWGASRKASFYFGGSPRVLSTEQVYDVIDKFAEAAGYAKEAGFDGVQLHAAHGYLIHQFILPTINQRKDEFQIDQDTKIGTRFLECIIDKVREKCGNDFILLVKISGSDDYRHPFTLRQLENLVSFLDKKKVDGIEISYGTMDYALNIIRGSIPLKVIRRYNPVFKTDTKAKGLLFDSFIYPFMKRKIKPFTPMYNLDYAKKIKEWTDIPVICVGGFRTGKEMREAVGNQFTDFVSVCRPLLCEPDFVNKVQQDENYISKCTNCNICTVMCDSDQVTACVQGRISSKGSKENG